MSEAVTAWLSSRAAWAKPATLRNDRSALTRFAGHVGKLQVHRLDHSHVESFMASLVDTMSPSSLNLMRSHLGMFIDYCRSRGWMTADLLSNIRPKQVQRRERRRLLAWELLALLDCAPHPRDRAMLAFAMNTGCRASEIVNIRLGALDLDRQEVELVVMKTGGSDTMPLTLDLVLELKAWLSYYQSRAGQLQAEWFLFPAKDGHKFNVEHPALRPTRPVSKPEDVVTAALSRFGWADTTGEGFHTIRRSVGRIYFDAASARGHDSALRETSALLHHANASTTERYLGISAERLKRDTVLRGQSFLTAQPAEAVELKAVSGDGTD